jgi:hypothetical protein
MITQEIEVVEAFQSLGVAPEVAMRAAAALYRREGDRLRETDASIAGVKGDLEGIRQDVAGLKTDATLLKWMVGFALIMLVTLLGKALIK